MRYLAKVERASFLGSAVLQLLARQLEDYLWETPPGEKTIETNITLGVGNGAIVLVDLDATNDEIVAVEEALPWLLHLVEAFLSQGITPEFLAQEAERAEQWRQSLTLESQEVERRALETAARRDEIQELEKSLRLEQQELEKREAELMTRIEVQKREALKLQELEKELRELEKSLTLEQEELEKRKAEFMAYIEVQEGKL